MGCVALLSDQDGLSGLSRPGVFGIARNMAKPFTGDPDVDFRVHMIPHHQGAIDMARVALHYAQDPWTRQAAQAIIIAQRREMYEFQGWLMRHGILASPRGKPRRIAGADY